MTKRTLKFICALLLISLPLHLPAQTPGRTDSTADDHQRVRGIQFSSREEAALALAKQQIPLLSGVSVSVDAVGAVMAIASPYGQLEAALRLNLKQRFFPIVELGWGISDHRDDNTDLHYKTQAPYFRLGMDYNFAKNPLTGNRIYGGLRYAFSSFKYDLDGPDIIDPVWGTATPYHFSGVKTGVQWMEAVFGLEARILRFFHLGWSVRYKFRLHEKDVTPGSAWYVPGFGRNGSHCLGGTFNLIFDISGGSKGNKREKE